MVSAPGFAFIALFVTATLIAVLIVERASQVFAVLGAAATVAVLAEPWVRGLAQWMPRAAAIVIVTLVGMFGTMAVLGVVAWDLDRQANVLSDSLHSAVADLPEGSTAAETAADLKVDERIDAVFDGAATRLVAGGTDPLAVTAQVAKVVVVRCWQRSWWPADARSSTPRFDSPAALRSAKSSTTPLPARSPVPVRTCAAPWR